MNFLRFKSTFQGFPVFSRLEIQKYFPDFDPKNLARWQDKGYLLKIRNTWYCFSDRQWDERQLIWVANRLNRPSYVSLETSLSYYGLIPEAVFTLQSVGTRKTSAYETPIGNFSYSKVKPSWFFGYRMERVGELFFAIAEPEKALLDLLYLRPDLQTEVQFEGLRLNIPSLIDVLDISKYQLYTEAFAGMALRRRARHLLSFIQQQRQYAFSG